MADTNQNTQPQNQMNIQGQGQPTYHEIVGETPQPEMSEGKKQRSVLNSIFLDPTGNRFRRFTDGASRTASYAGVAPQELINLIISTILSDEEIQEEIQHRISTGKEETLSEMIPNILNKANKKLEGADTKDILRADPKNMVETIRKIKRLKAEGRLEDPEAKSPKGFLKNLAYNPVQLSFGLVMLPPAMLTMMYNLGGASIEQARPFAQEHFPWLPTHGLYGPSQEVGPESLMEPSIWDEVLPGMSKDGVITNIKNHNQNTKAVKHMTYTLLSALSEGSPYQFRMELGPKGNPMLKRGFVEEEFGESYFDVLGDYVYNQPLFAAFDALALMGGLTALLEKSAVGILKGTAKAGMAYKYLKVYNAAKKGDPEALKIWQAINASEAKLPKKLKKKIDIFNDKHPDDLTPEEAGQIAELYRDYYEALTRAEPGDLALANRKLNGIAKILTGQDTFLKAVKYLAEQGSTEHRALSAIQNIDNWHKTSYRVLDGNGHVVGEYAGRLTLNPINRSLLKVSDSLYENVPLIRQITSAGRRLEEFTENRGHVVQGLGGMFGWVLRRFDRNEKMSAYLDTVRRSEGARAVDMADKLMAGYSNLETSMLDDVSRLIDENAALGSPYRPWVELFSPGKVIRKGRGTRIRAYNMTRAALYEYVKNGEWWVKRFLKDKNFREQHLLRIADEGPFDIDTARIYYDDIQKFFENAPPELMNHFKNIKGEWDATQADVREFIGVEIFKYNEYGRDKWRAESLVRRFLPVYMLMYDLPVKVADNGLVSLARQPRFTQAGKQWQVDLGDGVLRNVDKLIEDMVWLTTGQMPTPKYLKKAKIVVQEIDDANDVAAIRMTHKDGEQVIYGNIVKRDKDRDLRIVEPSHYETLGPGGETVRHRVDFEKDGVPKQFVLKGKQPMEVPLFSALSKADREALLAGRALNNPQTFYHFLNTENIPDNATISDVMGLVTFYLENGVGMEAAEVAKQMHVLFAEKLKGIQHKYQGKVVLKHEDVVSITDQVFKAAQDVFGEKNPKMFSDRGNLNVVKKMVGQYYDIIKHKIPGDHLPASFMSRMLSFIVFDDFTKMGNLDDLVRHGYALDFTTNLVKRKTPKQIPDLTDYMGKLKARPTTTVDTGKTMADYFKAVYGDEAYGALNALLKDMGLEVDDAAAVLMSDVFRKMGSYKRGGAKYDDVLEALRESMEELLADDIPGSPQVSKYLDPREMVFDSTVTGDIGKQLVQHLKDLTERTWLDILSDPATFDKWSTDPSATAAFWARKNGITWKNGSLHFLTRAHQALDKYKATTAELDAKVTMVMPDDIAQLVLNGNAVVDLSLPEYAHLMTDYRLLGTKSVKNLKKFYVQWDKELRVSRETMDALHAEQAFQQIFFFPTQRPYTGLMWPYRASLKDALKTQANDLSRMDSITSTVRGVCEEGVNLGVAKKVTYKDILAMMDDQSGMGTLKQSLGIPADRSVVIIDPARMELVVNMMEQQFVGLQQEIMHAEKITNIDDFLKILNESTDKPIGTFRKGIEDIAENLATGNEVLYVVDEFHFNKVMKRFKPREINNPKMDAVLDSVYRTPMKWWKSMVLLSRPKWYMNNLIGNFFLTNVLGGDVANNLKHSIARRTSPATKRLQNAIEKELPNSTAAGMFGAEDYGTWFHDKWLGENIRAGLQRFGTSIEQYSRRHFMLWRFTDDVERARFNNVVNDLSKADIDAKSVAKTLADDPKYLGELINYVDAHLFKYTHHIAEGMTESQRVALAVKRNIIPFYTWYNNIMRVYMEILGGYRGQVRRELLVHMGQTLQDLNETLIQNKLIEMHAEGNVRGIEEVQHLLQSSYNKGNILVEVDPDGIYTLSMSGPDPFDQTRPWIEEHHPGILNSVIGQQVMEMSYPLIKVAFAVAMQAGEPTTKVTYYRNDGTVEVVPKENWNKTPVLKALIESVPYTREILEAVAKHRMDGGTYARLKNNAPELLKSAILAYFGIDERDAHGYSFADQFDQDRPISPLLRFISMFVTVTKEDLDTYEHNEYELMRQAEDTVRDMFPEDGSPLDIGKANEALDILLSPEFEQYYTESYWNLCSDYKKFQLSAARSRNMNTHRNTDRTFFSRLFPDIDPVAEEVENNVMKIVFGGYARREGIVIPASASKLVKESLTEEQIRTTMDETMKMNFAPYTRSELDTAAVEGIKNISHQAAEGKLTGTAQRENAAKRMVAFTTYLLLKKSIKEHIDREQSKLKQQLTRMENFMLLRAQLLSNTEAEYERKAMQIRGKMEEARKAAYKDAMLTYYGYLHEYGYTNEEEQFESDMYMIGAE